MFPIAVIKKHAKIRKSKPLVCDIIFENLKKYKQENQDGGVGRHTAPPRTTRTDRESNGKGVRHQGNRK